jgi:hypothetical protein
MSTQEAPLARGDRVVLVSDETRRYKGTVVDDEYVGRKFVRWDNGRTWIYTNNELRRV